ncbi:sigma-54-dependent Fis family transcriptional regulator [bacterium]|nr:sigma-54-dependent Fis family transcriptional regulator [bacterium]MBU1984248.1 sigma-54-dependent Fis family transcriptional regulator [bacterium]
MTAKPGLLSMEHVLSVGRKILELRPLNEVLRAVTDAVYESMQAENALVILRDETTDRHTVEASRRADGEHPLGLQDLSQTLLQEAMTSRKPILTESAVEDPRFSGQSSVILQHIQAAVIVPLVGRDRVEGAIYADSRTDRASFREENLGMLATLAAFCALAIENAKRYDSTRRELNQLKKSGEPRRGRLIGSSPVMQQLYSLIDRVAATDLPVFISGESGTGKELVAREIHDASSRAGKPFVALYCGNVSTEIFESELFGHKVGSFTGAVADKPGLVEAAAKGTLFLDEIADISMPLQAKLLRFLQDWQFRRVGETSMRQADVRVIAATNKDLPQQVAEGRFREDLYYRLYILPIVVPPLRERVADIPHLVRHFLGKNRKTHSGPTGIAPEALRQWMNYPWPGNVRELENAVARAQVIASGDRVEVSDLVDVRPNPPIAAKRDLSWSAAERRHVLEVLAVCDGNKSRAAKVLGVSRRYLYYKLEEWAKLDSGNDAEQTARKAAR